MKIFQTISIIFLQAVSGVALAAPSSLFCHDQYGSQNSTVFLTAQILDGKNLAQVSISCGKLLSDVKLAIKNMPLESANEEGVPLLLSAIHASKFSATVPGGVNYDPNFTVIFKLGSQWLESQSGGPFVRAQVQLYPDEAGGGLPKFAPNLYCELK